MPIVNSFDTPARLRDVPFEASSFYPAWDRKVGEIVGTSLGQRVDPRGDGDATEVVAVRTLSWIGFPREQLVLQRDDREAAFREADRDRENQPEYFEWHVSRDADGKITKVLFSVETPAYFEVMAETEPDRLVELHQELVDPAVQREHLFRDGRYDPMNRWTRTDLAAKVEEITAGSGLLDLVPGDLAGHEHFGLKDGVSQPGVRGRLSDDDHLTPRHLLPDDPADRRPRAVRKPGQLLVWPGQFLLGELRQDPQDVIESEPEQPAGPFPEWAALGSYLVCRRLRQDVPAFWAFATAAAERVDVEPVRFASMLVGRWPSGAPIMRTPLVDDAALAGDEYADNHLLFDDDTREVRLRPMEGYSGDLFRQARADMLGTACPHFAHIRKTNPRDSATDLGKPHDSMLRMILRRGIPYGPPVIGQRDSRGDRERFVDVPFEGRPSVRVPLGRDWVVPTGGGYFFAPPISALTTVLGGS